MVKYKRNLVLDIFNYSNEKVCPIYDSSVDVEGQAHDVVVSYERNGWKELSFSIPCKCGTEDNYKLDYLINDYKIRLIDDNETDWYIISEPKITHTFANKDVSVTCGHCSQLLKTKKLELEFSDDEGNNVGTAEQLLTTILDGTGWNVGTVYDFKEKYDSSTTKIRSLKASSKTGAFKLITSLCDLFEAKPVFHGDTRKVDIIPMNPFSKIDKGDYSEILNADDIIEMHYGTNVKSITRTVNSENIATKLYAYGSYGDKTHGYCGISECEHLEFLYTLSSDGSEFNFNYTVNGDIMKRYFISASEWNAGDELMYSLLDPCSMMYIWNKTKEEAAFVYEGYLNSNSPLSPSSSSSVENVFSFIMDFDYYNENGFITENMLQTIANYQVKGSSLLKQVNEASTAASETHTKLSETIGSVTFCKLNVKSIDRSSGYIHIELDIDEGEQGIAFRSDYTDKYMFTWNVASKIKENGIAVDSEASILYCLHNADPITWDKTYLKEIYYIDTDKKHPKDFYIWSDSSDISLSDTFYLFQTNCVNGVYLGTYEELDKAATESVNSATKVITEEHPVTFTKDTVSSVAVPNENTDWAWLIQYKENDNKEDLSEMYFCYRSLGDSSWSKVTVLNEDPTDSIENSIYVYNENKSTVFRYNGASWVKFTSTQDKNIAAVFGTIIRYSLARDRYYKGIYNSYKVIKPGDADNYYIDSLFDIYWIFTTTKDLSNDSDYIEFDSSNGRVGMYENGTASDDDWVATTSQPISAVLRHPENVFETNSWVNGSIDLDSGGDVSSSDKYRSSYLNVYTDLLYEYTSSESFKLFFYNEDKEIINIGTDSAPKYYIDCSTSGQFTTPHNSKVVRALVSSSSATITMHVPTWETDIIIPDNYGGGTTYHKLIPSSHGDSTVSIIQMMSDMKTYIEQWISNRNTLTDCQNQYTEFNNEMQESIGDIYKESTWQDSNYVDGDETKLYDDAMENLEQISYPDITYNVSFLDLYGSEPYITDYLSVNNDSSIAKWPDITISYAVHIVDPDISVNKWAYIDKLQKCYDMPWKTTLSINTDLSTISYHSFSDVLSNIATVASETNAKQDVYSRAETIQGDGTIDLDSIVGTVDTSKLAFDGGASCWYTDSNGNIILESADGSSAMKLSGSGFAIANTRDVYGDWQWNTFGTGNGFNADLINSGYIKANLIKAGSISADKLAAQSITAGQIEAGTITANQIKSNSITVNELASDVGEKLDISSNQALTLFATKSGTVPAGAVDGKIESAKVYDDDGAWLSIAPDGVEMSGESVAISAGELNVSSNGEINIENGGDLNVSSDGKINLNGGEIEAKTDNSEINISNDGITVSGSVINLNTSSTDQSKTGIIYLGNEDNYIDSNGNLHLSNGAESIDMKASDGSFATTGNLIISSNTTGANGSIQVNSGSNIEINDGGSFTVKSNGKIDLQSGSTFTVDSNNFDIDEDGNVTLTGEVTAASGAIGGWTLTENNINSGEGTTYVALSSDENGNYVMWAGDEMDEEAPFKIARNGTVYLTNLAWVDKDGKVQPALNLRTNAWKLNRAVQTLEISEDTNTLNIKLFDGTEVNFSKPVGDFDIDGAWLNNVYMATATSGSAKKTVSTELNKIVGQSNTIGYKKLDSGIVYLTGTINVYADEDTTAGTFNIGGVSSDGTIYITDVYNSIYSEASDAAKSSVTLSKDGWSEGNLIVSNSANDNTVSINLSENVSEASAVYTESTNKYLVSIPITDNNEATGTNALLDFEATESYNNGYSSGQSEAKSSVTLSKGAWSNGIVYISNSANDKTANVILSTGVAQCTYLLDKKYQISIPILDNRNSTGANASYQFEANDAYNDGIDYEKSQVALSRTSWVNHEITISNNANSDTIVVALSENDKWETYDSNKNEYTCVIRIKDNNDDIAIASTLTFEATDAELNFLDNLTLSKSWSDGIALITVPKYSTVNGEKIELYQSNDASHSYDSSSKNYSISIPIYDDADHTLKNTGFFAAYTFAPTEALEAITLSKSAWDKTNKTITISNSANSNTQTVSLKQGTTAHFYSSEDNTYSVYAPILDGDDDSTGLTVQHTFSPTEAVDDANSKVSLSKDDWNEGETVVRNSANSNTLEIKIVEDAESAIKNYNSTDNKYTITIPIKDNSGNSIFSALYSFVAEESYSNAEEITKEAVALTKGSWSSGQVSITNSANSNKEIVKLLASKDYAQSEYDSENNQYRVSVPIYDGYDFDTAENTGLSAYAVVDASDAKSAGETEAKAAVVVSKGSWIDGQVIISNSANETSTQTVSLSQGTSSHVYSTETGKYTVYAPVLDDSDPTKFTVSYTFDPTEAYDKGESDAKKSVTLTKGAWSSGILYVSNSANSNTSKITLSTGTPTAEYAGSKIYNISMAILDTGNATGAKATYQLTATGAYDDGYNAGYSEGYSSAYNEGWAAAYAMCSASRSGNVITVKMPSSTPDVAASDITYTITAYIDPLYAVSWPSTYSVVAKGKGYAQINGTSVSTYTRQTTISK